LEQAKRSFSGQYYLTAIGITALILTLPVVSSFFFWLYFITPLPVIYYITVLGFKRGSRLTAYAAIPAAGLIMITAADVQIVFSALSLIPAGIILGQSINQGDSIHRAGFKGIGAIILTWLVLGIAFSAFSQVNIYKAVLKEIDTSLSIAFKSYSTSPGLTPASKAQLKEVFQRTRETVPRIFPGSLLISAICTIWLNLLLANHLLKRSGIKVWDDFRRWRLPDNLIWLFIAGVFALMIPSSWLNTAGLNIVLVLGFLYFLQGLAVLTSLMEKWEVPRPIRFLIYIIITIQAYGIIMLAFLGIVEIWANFRKAKPIDKINGE